MSRQQAKQFPISQRACSGRCTRQASVAPAPLPARAPPAPRRSLAASVAPPWPSFARASLPPRPPRRAASAHRRRTRLALLLRHEGRVHELRLLRGPDGVGCSVLDAAVVIDARAAAAFAFASSISAAAARSSRALRARSRRCASRSRSSSVITGTTTSSARLLAPLGPAASSAARAASASAYFCARLACAAPSSRPCASRPPA